MCKKVNRLLRVYASASTIFNRSQECLRSPSLHQDILNEGNHRSWSLLRIAMLCDGLYELSHNKEMSVHTQTGNEP